MIRTLVIKATAGDEDPERCAEAFTTATDAAADGTAVSFWLAGEASKFALPGGADSCELPTARPLRDMLDQLIEQGRVTLCRHCAARRKITIGAIRPGVRMAGAAVFVEECLNATQATVY